MDRLVCSHIEQFLYVSTLKMETTKIVTNPKYPKVLNKD